MDFEMGTSSLPLSSSAASNDNDNSDGMEDEEEQDSLWSIEDDTLFFASHLMNHSVGRSKSVFVTWNESYLLNFVFKTSGKSQKTIMTKVRLSMPLLDDEPEEINDMQILEMNTLLLMKSGRVYYFSSVKSIHTVPWLMDVYAITSCPQTQFSVIRFLNNVEEQTKQLLLEVYQDIPQLGMCPSRKDVLRHSYDISFDVHNLFNCDWHCERYSILSLITDQENIDFLRRILAMGNFMRSEEDEVQLELNQEVHIFTISGNIFVLVGAHGNGCPHPEVVDYTIQLLNTYATAIECVRIDFKRNLLMVILQSGHMDVWYKSTQMFGSIRHLCHEISYFTHYDYSPSDNTFYFTKPEEVTQLRIVYNNDQGGSECMIREIHKSIGGMIACTWVESLQQLITLSINNIFYRLCFDASTSCLEFNIDYDNLNTLYALTSKKMKELLSKALIVSDLMEQPKQLHEAVGREWQKQQLLSLGFKRQLWRKVLKCHIEYHMDMPTMQYFVGDLLLISTSFDQDVNGNDHNTIYSLIYLTLTKNDGIFLSILQTASWQLQISVDGKSLLLQVPSDMIHKKLCFIVKYSMRNRNTLPDFSVNLLTFINHCSVYICANFDVSIIKNEKTYRNIFSNGVQEIPLFCITNYDIDYLIEECNKRSISKESHCEVPAAPKLKQIFLIPKQELLNILNIYQIKYENILNANSKLYFLRQYALHLNYNENCQQLIITSHQPAALYYIKVFLMYELKYGGNIDVDLTESKSLHQTIMQYQCDVERLYGSLISSEYMDDDSGTISLHLETLLKVYSKLRCEFNEIFR